MSDKKQKLLFSLSEEYARIMLDDADRQIEMIVDLLLDKCAEETLDLATMSLLCDSFSANYHIWRILKMNLKTNIVKDKEKGNVIALSEQDIFMTENAVLAKSFSIRELLKLNYSLSLH